MPIIITTVLEKYFTKYQNATSVNLNLKERAEHILNVAREKSKNFSPEIGIEIPCTSKVETNLEMGRELFETFYSYVTTCNGKEALVVGRYVHKIISLEDGTLVIYLTSEICELFNTLQNK